MHLTSDGRSMNFRIQLFLLLFKITVKWMYCMLQDFIEIDVPPASRLQWNRCTASFKTRVKRIHHQLQDYGETYVRPVSRLEWNRYTTSFKITVKQIYRQLQDYSETDALPASRLQWNKCTANFFPAAMLKFIWLVAIFNNT
jgi:hypothetical protein